MKTTLFLVIVVKHTNKAPEHQRTRHGVLELTIPAPSSPGQPARGEQPPVPDIDTQITYWQKWV